MDRPASVEGLVIAGGVDRERTEELAVLAHDADVSAGHEDEDRLVAVRGSDADVSEPAAIAQGDGADLVDPVMANAVLDGSGLSSRAGLEPSGEGRGRCTAVKRAVRPRLVVVEAERVELRRELRQAAPPG